MEALATIMLVVTLSLLVAEPMRSLIACGIAVYWLVTAALLRGQRIRPGHWVGVSPSINLALAAAVLAFALPSLLTHRPLAAESPGWQHALVWVSCGLFIVAALLSRRSDLNRQLHERKT